MSLEAQLRLKEKEFEESGAAVYVILRADLYRTALYKKRKKVPFTMLSDPAGGAGALYGVCRNGLQMYFADPGVFVIDRTGVIRFARVGYPPGKEELGREPSGEPKWTLGYAELLLEEVKKAAQ